MGESRHAVANDRIDRTRLPVADPEFAGVANRTCANQRTTGTSAHGISG